MMMSQVSWMAPKIKFPQLQPELQSPSMVLLNLNSWSPHTICLSQRILRMPTQNQAAANVTVHTPKINYSKQHKRFSNDRHYSSLHWLVEGYSAVDSSILMIYALMILRCNLFSFQGRSFVLLFFNLNFIFYFTLHYNAAVKLPS